MLAPRFIRRFRSLQRLREVLGVLARHGFGHLIRRIGLQRLVPVRRRLTEPEEPVGSAAARRAVAACQELGPTFVKLGQMLATRPDLLPPEWIEELRALHDRVAPFETQLALDRVAEELGAPAEEVFEEFDPEPFAAGSMAQCYRATGRDGTPLVVKVMRPGIERIVLRDLDLLLSLARLVERHAPEYRLYQPVMIVEELARTMKRELDFVGEATSTERFRRDMADFEEVGVPRVYWDLTTSRVMALERMSGENLQVLLDRSDSALDRKALARRLCDTFMHQFFISGFYHADPHPGNLLVAPPARLNIIDFGMVGHLTDRMRGDMATVALALAMNNLDILVDVFQEMGAVGSETHPEDLKLEMLHILDKYYTLPAGRLDFGQIFTEFTEAARRHHMQLPREMVMLGRAFITVAALAVRLDPDLQLAEVVRPYAKRLVLEKLSPKYVTGRLLGMVRQIGTLLGTAPRDLRTLARKAVRGELQLTLHHRQLDHLIAEMDRASNRLSFAVTIAAIIIASAMIIRMEVGKTVLGVSWLGLVGFVIAGLLALWLLVAILRSGRL